MTPGVALPREVEAAMVGHARRAAPAECCGLLLGRDRSIEEAVPARNLADDPRRRYLIEPQDHFEAVRTARRRGLQVVGVYHSHPRSGAEPSRTDAAEAFGQFIFLILGLGDEPPTVAAWEWIDGNFARLPLVRDP